MTTRKEELAQLERSAERRRAKLRKELTPALSAVLANPDGQARLLAITDEEWQAAVDADSGEIEV